MEKYSWPSLLLLVVTSVVALYVGLTTKPGPRAAHDPAWQLKSYARTVGLIVGIGGWPIAFRLLLILLKQGR